jgi:hypothetical protein
MLKYTTIELELSPEPLTEQQWQQTLQTHREAMIAQLRAVFRKELVVSKKKRTEIENAAHGIWQ